MAEPDLSGASARWRDALAAWAIPPEILAQAPEDPWAPPVALFHAHAAEMRVTPSHRIAGEALPQGGVVLDVGAGGCAMSLPLRPPASRIVAVDARAEMLEGGPADEQIVGTWPEAAARAGRADVVVCGHVLYNVPDLVPFVRALDAAARRRVVVEITLAHPRASEHSRVLWRHFWGIDRPLGPTYEDAVAVLREAGLAPEITVFEGGYTGGFERREDLVAWLRRSTCLPASRDAEVWELMSPFAAEREGRWLPTVEPRRMATLWWDATGAA